MFMENGFIGGVKTMYQYKAFRNKDGCLLVRFDYEDMKDYSLKVKRMQLLNLRQFIFDNFFMLEINKVMNDFGFVLSDLSIIDYKMESPHKLQKLVLDGRIEFSTEVFSLLKDNSYSITNLTFVNVNSETVTFKQNGVIGLENNSAELINYLTDEITKLNYNYL